MTRKGTLIYPPGTLKPYPERESLLIVQLVLSFRVCQARMICPCGRVVRTSEKQRDIWIVIAIILGLTLLQAHWRKDKPSIPDTPKEMSGPVQRIEMPTPPKLVLV
jgi:hypothetical protein